MADLLVAEALAGVDQDDAQALLARSGGPAASVDVALKWTINSDVLASLQKVAHPIPYLNIPCLPLMFSELGSGSHAGRC